jgi:hypothetical protein
MDQLDVTDNPNGDPPWFGRIPAFALHTAIVYTYALRISGFLVGRWFAWVAPALQIASSVQPTAWYMQHLEVVMVAPALLAGYVNIARFVPAIVDRRIASNRSDPAITWSWVIPTLVLLFEMLRYHPESSVLIGTSVTRFGYFFDIQRVGPTWAARFDPVRLADQLLVTGPFYAGIGYSLGALLSKHRVLVNLFTFEKGE